MATYTELFTLRSNQTLQRRVAVACVIAAETIRLEAGGTANHTQRLAWANTVYANPDNEAVRMMSVVLAQNKTATVAQIEASTDAVLQAAVDAAVNVFAVGV